MEAHGGARTNPTAVVAFVVSLLGFVCLFGVGGVVGVVLGVLAKGEIRRSDPPEQGGRLATAAVVLGLLQIALCVIAIGAAIAGLMRPARAPAIARHPTAAPAPVRPAPSARPSPPGAPGARGTLDTHQRESAIGRITLVDLGTDSGPLSQVFQNQYQRAQASGGRAIAFVVGPDCSPCNGVALALTDPRLQRALGGSRLVRIDVRERAEELTLLGIPVETIPGLALLAPGARPADYLHGGEWDADVPDNIAPVLSDFVAGGARPRRYPWRGLRRPDETTL
jgi:hypothetical protein